MIELFSLKDKKAIVVGGAGDLGLAMLEAVLEAGAEAVAIDIHDSVLELKSRLTEAEFSVSGVQADISDRAQVIASYGRALELLDGRVDILINAAGIQRRHPSEEFPEEDWDAIIAVNLSAVFLFCQMAGRSMIAQGGGKIINVSSIMSQVGGIKIPAYTASKGGVTQMTKTLANDWAGKNICVNSIAPGYMDTQLNAALLYEETRSTAILSRIPANRWGVANDLKGVTVFLSSSASDYVNGAEIPVDGGYLGR